VRASLADKPHLHCTHRFPWTHREVVEKHFRKGGEQNSMYTKEEFAHALQTKLRTSSFQNAGHWFGLVYRSLRLSMLLEPDRREILRERRKALLAAWREFAIQHQKGGESHVN
jgi:hypothetical protein